MTTRFSASVFSAGVPGSARVGWSERKACSRTVSTRFRAARSARLAARLLIARWLFTSPSVSLPTWAKPVTAARTWARSLMLRRPRATLVSNTSWAVPAS